MQSSTKTSVKYLHLCYVRARLLSTCSTKANRNADLVNNTESDWKSPLWSKFYINAGLFCICSLCIWGFTVIFRDAVSCSSIQVALCLQVIWLFCLLVIYTSLAVRVKDISNSEKLLTLQTMVWWQMHHVFPQLKRDGYSSLITISIWCWGDPQKWGFHITLKPQSHSGLEKKQLYRVVKKKNLSSGPAVWENARILIEVDKAML